MFLIDVPEEILSYLPTNLLEQIEIVRNAENISDLSYEQNFIKRLKNDMNLIVRKQR